MSNAPVRTPLVFAVVTATGSPLETFLSAFSRLMPKYGYDAVPIRLTGLLQEHVASPDSIVWANEGERIQKMMDAGDQFRTKVERSDAMALLAVLGIQAAQDDHDATRSYAYVIRQLKHPDEVSTLRQIYGDRLFVLGLYSTYSERLKHLTEVLKIDNGVAEQLIERDEADEYTEWGQRTRDAFELGDVFFRIDEPNCTDAMVEAERFLDLIFGCPELSPRSNEHAMYLAYAASLRSADLSRQVGAVVTNEDGDVVAVGANDVPKAGGGQYWPGKHDHRDHTKREDSNTKHRLKIARDIFERTQSEKKDDGAAFKEFMKSLDGSLLLDITEYGRPVHAEMDAILSCARNGIATRRGHVFCTTFPCHNCAKHLVDAGIKEVQYVEAYPKSLATKLHSDAIFWEEEAGSEEAPGGRVVFKHYVGVGARRYMDLFSLTLSSGRRVKRKNKVGEISVWDATTAEPRVPSDTASFDLEMKAIDELRIAMKGPS